MVWFVVLVLSVMSFDSFAMEKNIPKQDKELVFVKEPEFKEISLAPGFCSWLDEVKGVLNTYPVNDQAALRASLLKSFHVTSSEQLLPRLKNAALSLYIQHKFMGSIDLRTFLFLKRQIGNPPQTDNIKFLTKDGKRYGFYKENMSVADFEEAINNINTVTDQFGNENINSTPEVKFSIAIKVAASQGSKGKELAQFLVDEAHLMYSKDYEQLAQDNYNKFVNANILQNTHLSLVPFIVRWALKIDKIYKNRTVQDLNDAVYFSEAINNRHLSLGYQQLESYYINLYNSVMLLFNTLLQETNSSDAQKAIVIKAINTNTLIKLPGVAGWLPDTLINLNPAKTYLKLPSYHSLINTLINQRVKDLALQREQCTIQKPIPLTTDERGATAFKHDKSNKLVIQDACNGAQITLIKSTEKPFTMPAIKYTKNVMEWFDAPDAAKNNQGYLIAGSRKHSLTVHEGYDPVLLHAFSTLVDRFIPDYATQTQTPSRRKLNQQDVLYTIPGAITDKNGKEFMGIFTYLQDSATGKIYHRFFEAQLGSQLIKGFYEKGYFAPAANGYYDLAFPPLNTDSSENNKSQLHS